MPDKPIWSGRLTEIAQQLRELPDPWVDSSLLQNVLDVGARRAQQILSPCVVRRVGASGLAEREAVIEHLNRLAAGENARFEEHRRHRFAERLDALYQERREGLIVAAPIAVVNQQLLDLPPGVDVSAGHISVTFETAVEALQKLLALAMAIRNDEPLFERLAVRSNRIDP